MFRSIVSAVNSAVDTESVFVGNSLSSSDVISGKTLSFSTVAESFFVGIIDSIFIGNCSGTVETLELLCLGDCSRTLELSKSVFAGDCNASGAITDSVFMADLTESQN